MARPHTTFLIMGKNCRNFYGGVIFSEKIFQEIFQEFLNAEIFQKFTVGRTSTVKFSRNLGSQKIISHLNKNLLKIKIRNI